MAIADSTLAEILADAAASAILEKYLPGMASAPQAEMVKNWKLEQIAAVASDLLTPEIVRNIAADLAQLEA